MEACERRSHSDWKCVNTGDPQGTKAPSSLFLVIVNDLKITPNLRKFVNDATLLEVLTRCFCPNQPTTVTKCEDCWTVRNNMKLNGTKTKGMDSWSLHQPAIQAYIVIVDHQIDTWWKRQNYTPKDLKWSKHIHATDKKTSKCLKAVGVLTRKWSNR